MSERETILFDALLVRAYLRAGLSDRYIAPGGLSRMRFYRRHLSLLGLVALANTNCATTIAARHPHLDRRSVCVLPQEIENDSTEYVFTENNIPISNFDPEVADRVAENARTVFEYDPEADPNSPQYLPAPYNDLTCPERFSVLRPKESNTKPLPVAAVNLLLHERRPEAVSKALTDELAKCGRLVNGQVDPIQHTMQVHVYVKNSGQTVAAFVATSTLKNRPFDACVANIFRSTQWSAMPESAPNVAAAPVALKGLFAQPAPVQPQPDPGPESGIRRIQPPLANEPTGRIPRVFVIPINPLVAALVVFGIVYFWLDTDAPAWSSELNPITRQPYSSYGEYQEVQWLSPEEIQQRRAAHIKSTESQPPPAPVPPPAPSPQASPEPAPQKQPDPKCEKTTAKIDEIINKERDATPPGGKPQGRKGIKWRWWEIGENKGKWGPKPDGSPSKQMQGHLDAYGAGQTELMKALTKWYKDKCDQKGYTLPHNALQYAAQTPEFGPGKPLEPAPTPIWTPQAVNPIMIVPQPKKASK